MFIKIENKQNEQNANQIEAMDRAKKQIDQGSGLQIQAKCNAYLFSDFASMYF